MTGANGVAPTTGPRALLDQEHIATGARSIVAGVLMCVAGLALVLLAKNGLTGFAGWAALGSFLAAALIARVSASGEDREDREDMDVPELGPRTAGRR